MTTEIVNERDKMLQNASIRVQFARTGQNRAKIVEVNPTTYVFVVDENNAVYPETIGISATRYGLTNAAEWSVTEGTATLNISGGGCTLRPADMTTDRVTIRATVTETIDGGPLPADIKPVGQENTPWKIKFNDEFSGTGIDTTRWNLRFHSDASPVEDSATVSSGALRLYPTAAFEKRVFTTHGKFAQTTGYFEVRAQLPKGKGLIPRAWLYHHDHATDRPRYDILRAHCSGTAKTENTSTGSEANSIRIDYYGDQLLLADGASSKEANANPHMLTVADNNLDAAYVVNFEQVKWWNSSRDLRNGSNTTAFNTAVDASSATVIVIQTCWTDRYENISTSDYRANLRAMIDYARSRGKFVMLQTPHDTDDSSWHNHRDSMYNVAKEKSVPLIDVYYYTSRYISSNKLSIYSVCPGGKYANVEHHKRIGIFIASRIKEIAAADSNFPKPSATTPTTTAGGGGWATADFTPIDYAGQREFNNGSTPQITTIRLSANRTETVELSAAMHYYGVRIDNDGYQFFFDGAAVGAKQAASNMQLHPLYLLLSLEYESDSALAPNATDTPTGVTNSFAIDYARVWELDTSGGATPTPTPGTTPAPSPSPSTDVRPVGHGSKTWPLVFRDEFASSGLNSAHWNDAAAWLTAGPVNYDVNASSNSMLRIWPESTFTSRNITTHGKKEWKYGYFEVRAKLAQGQGLWEFFELFNHADNSKPAIGLMETFASYAEVSVNKKPNDYYVNAFVNGTDAKFYKKMSEALGKKDLTAAQHTYGCLWASDRIELYFEGQLVHRYYTNEFKVPMYMRLGLAFGSAAGDPDSTTPLGSNNSIEIDYVRVWSFDGATV